MIKFAKLHWGRGFVIVKDFVPAGEEAVGITGINKKNYNDRYFKRHNRGILIYGSRRKYKDSGKFFTFGYGKNEPDRIEELDEKEVVKEYFVALL